MFRNLMRPTAVAAIVLVALAAWPVAEAQFGGGGYGGEGYEESYGAGGYGGGYGAGMMAQGFGDAGLGEGMVSGASIIIQGSKSGKSLYGYSETTGRWDKLSAEPHPEQGLTPIVAETVAVVGGKTQLHAFSTEFGKWITVDVGEPVDASRVMVSATRVVYRTDTHIHVFSNASGKWGSVDFTED